MSERRSPIELGRQLRLLTPLFVVWAVGAATVAVVGLQTAVPVGDLFLDPSNIAGLPWYTGMLSSVGLVGWAAAATAAAGGAWIAGETGRPSAARFLVGGSVVSAILLFDDMLLLHSDAVPRLLGVPKPMAVAVLGLIAATWMGVFVAEIARTRWLVLASGLVAFGASIATDQVGGWSRTALLIEDGAKFLGVLAWMLYFVLTTRDIARSTVRAAIGAGRRVDLAESV